MVLSMKEIHAYRNEDGTYKLELIADFYDKGELVEARIIYESVRMESRDLVMRSHGELFSVSIADSNDYANTVEINGVRFVKEKKYETN